MSKWQWALVGVGTILVACVVFAYFFGVQAEYVWEMGRAAHKDPAYWVKPVELRDLIATQSPGMKLSYLGYEFEVPWDDIDREKSRTAKPDKVAVIVFRSGRVISVWKRPANEFVDGLLGDKSASPQAFAQVFGENTVNSDYDFTRALLDVTPNDLSLFISRRQAVQKGTLLLMKIGVVHHGSASGVFLFDTAEFKGIQFGNPQTQRDYCNVELFNTDAKLMIVFGNSRSGNANISQSDVNRVVQSVRKLTSPEGSIQK